MESMRLIRIFFLGLLVQVNASAQVRPASIEGFVIKAGTGEPVSKAIVTLTGGSGPNQHSVTTADGRFVFQNLQQASYRITVSRNGYLNSSYGSRGPNGPGAVLPVAAGQTLKD